MLVVLVVLLVLPLPPRRHDLPPGLRGGPLRPLLPSLPVLSLLLLHDGGLVGFLVHLSLQGHPLGAPSLGVNGLPLLLRQDTLQLFLQLVRPVQDLPGFSTELPLFFVFGLLGLLGFDANLPTNSDIEYFIIFSYAIIPVILKIISFIKLINFKSPFIQIFKK